MLHAINSISALMEDRIDRFGSPSIGTNDTLNSIDSVKTSEVADFGGESQSSALLGLFFYSILMFTVPLGAFFMTKHYLEEHLNLGYVYNLLIPVILSVVLVNLIIMLYVFRAFREDKKDREFSSRPIEERKKRE